MTIMSVYVGAGSVGGTDSVADTRTTRQQGAEGDNDQNRAASAQSGRVEGEAHLETSDTVAAKIPWKRPVSRDCRACHGGGQETAPAE